jgi:hypothetical protein
VLGLVVGVELAWLLVEAVAAAAAVVRPANASRSPQARIERRNAFTSQVDCKSEAERAGYARKRAPLGAAYAIGVTTVAIATFVLC